MNRYCLLIIVCFILKPVLAKTIHSLVDAIEANDFQKASEIIKARVINLDQYVSLYTPLLWACEDQRPEIVKLLLDHGANPNKEAQNSNLTPLGKAILKGNIEIVELLLKSGADPNKTFDASPVGGRLRAIWLSQSPLMVAATLSRKKIVERLLREKIKINYQDPDGYSALMKAVEYSNLSIVKLLVENGAIKSLKTKRGLTAADLARQYKKESLVEVLKD